MQEDEKQRLIMEHIERLTSIVGEAFKKNAGSMVFGLPMPRNEIEREATSQFAKLVAEASGRKVEFIPKPSELKN